MPLVLSSKADLCPVCGREFSDPQTIVSILPAEFPNASLCPNCRSPLRFSSFPGGAIEPSEVPVRVMLLDHGATWSATAYPHRTAAVETWVFSLVWTAIVAFMWSANAAGHGAGIVVLVWLTVVTPLFVLKAALQTWGKYVVAGSPQGAKIFTGIASLGVNRHFKWEDLSEIRLRTRYGRRGSRRKSVVARAGREFSFGEELSDDQRHFVALFLLSKRSLL